MGGERDEDPIIDFEISIVGKNLAARMRCTGYGTHTPNMISTQSKRSHKSTDII